MKGTSYNRLIETFLKRTGPQRRIFNFDKFYVKIRKMLPEIEWYIFDGREKIGEINCDIILPIIKSKIVSL